MTFVAGNNNSEVWKHFLQSKDLQLAKCKTCSKEIKCKGGSTSGMRSHLKLMHHIEADAMKQVSAKVEQKVGKIDHFFVTQKDSSAVVLSELVAIDGLPIRVLAKIQPLRAALGAQGYHLPKDAKSIKAIIMKHCLEVKDIYKKQFEEMKKDKICFSITLDEYTSSRNRRFININVHVKNRHWNLGMVRIFGSMPADKAVTIVREKLKEFGICLDSDIVAATTDGAAVMKKFRKAILPTHQLCLAHGIHLAVCDVLYKTTPVQEVIPDLDKEEDFALDDISISDDSDYEDEEGVGLQVSIIYNYSKV